MNKDRIIKLWLLNKKTCKLEEVPTVCTPLQIIKIKTKAGTRMIQKYSFLHKFEKQEVTGKIDCYLWNNLKFA